MLDRELLSQSVPNATKINLKRRQEKCLVFYSSLLETPFYACINKFTSTMNEILLYHGASIAIHLVQTHNIRTSCTGEEIMLFDDDVVGSFRNVKIQREIASSHACYI